MLTKKKANEAFFGLALGIFIAAGIILVNLSMNQPNVDFVGETAQTVLANSEKQQRSFLYVDQAVDDAALQAAQHVFNADGFTDKANCKQLGYTVINESCQQDLQTTFTDELRKNLEIAGQNIPDQPDQISLASTLDESTWQISYESESSLLYTVDSQISTNQDRSEQVGQTAWGEPIVSVNDISNVQCDTGQSCTGYQKQCAVKPGVYDKLQDLSEYAAEHGLTVNVRSTTRTEEMQRFFAEEQAYCERTKPEICDADASDQECAQTYREHLDSNNMDNRLACNTAGTCSPACDPTTTTETGQEVLNKGCTHMTGNAIDIGLQRQDGTLINNDPDLRDPMRKALCDLGFINNYDEIWHYEYRSPQWRNIRQNNPQGCAYNDGDKDWSQVTPLHEVIAE